MSNEESNPPTSAVLIIPARYGSTRFPGKPLARLGDRTVIEHVAAAALRTRAARPVLVATDDERIAAAIRDNFKPQDAAAVLTSSQCATGTDRLAEVVRARFADRLENERLIVVNIQGDEPFIEPRPVDALIEAMRADTTLKMATLATPLAPEREADPNVVKVVCDGAGHALYFSRLPIPFEREAGDFARLRHLGIYAYEANWLLAMAGLAPTPLERAESLEQLRALEHGVRIRVLVVDEVAPIAIDTPGDLRRAAEYLRER
jgi:3-deoxy-manno-octulosonate cytidylyltransferase (CMP-KDO synthetase)